HIAPPGCIGGDLLYQLRSKRGFKDSNLGRQSRWLELRFALLTMRRGLDRFCPKFPDRLFPDACLVSIHKQTDRKSCSTTIRPPIDPYNAFSHRPLLAPAATLSART